MIRQREKEKNNDSYQRRKKRRVLSIVLILIILASIIGVAVVYVNITITWIVPEMSPSITLDDPANGSTQTSLPIQFNWTSIDPDSDTLTHVWYCDISPLFISPFKQIVNIGENQTYNATLDDGHWYWKVEVTDNDGINISEVWDLYVGENLTNIYPYLENATVYPSTGNTTVTYTYNITFYDADNDTASFVRVYIDGVQHNMNEVDPADVNTTDGKNYTYSTNLAVGNHNYTFVCKDNDALNITELYLGPNVSSTPPTQSNESPTDGSDTIPLQPLCSITVNDYDADTMNIYFFSNYSGSWTNYQTNASVSNGTYTWNFTGANSNGIKYYWSVNVTDGSTWSNQTYNFTTISENIPQQSNENPNDGETNVSRTQPNVSVYIFDINGDTMNWTIEVNNSDTNSGTGSPNATINCSLSTPLSYSTSFTWWVNITDGTYWNNQTYSFITVGITPIFSNPSPTNGSDGICPCCAPLCIDVINRKGNNFNITFYRNDSQFNGFYIINKLINVSNNTYCFCIDGHINSSIFYPVKYNETYYWYVNVTDVELNEYNISEIYHFTTESNLSNCPCGIEQLTELINNTASTGIRDDAWIVGVVLVVMVLPLALALKNRNRKNNKRKNRRYPVNNRRYR